jgi:NADPH:quinone reductase-like Zn-dependent oxidoreductase
MRAFICTRYGPPEVLRLAEVERPIPRRNQIRIRIFATAVTVSSTTNLKLVESLGAEAVLDYTREEFASRGERYDLIFDAVGKRKSAGAMRNAGRALTTGGACISIDDDFPKPTRQDLDLLKRLAESGALKPVIDRRYRLEEIIEAHRYVELGHKKGNVIVTVGPRQTP